MSESKSFLQVALKHLRDGADLDPKVYRAAMKAAADLDAIFDLPEPVVEGKEYLVVSPNGSEHRVFVPKGADIFRICREQRIEIQSFSRV